MPYLFIPREVATHSADVWVAVVDETPDIETAYVEFNGQQLSITNPWSEWRSLNGQHVVRHQVVRLGGLQPRRKYAAVLNVDGEQRADCSVTCLPERCPSTDEPKPFTLLLGSCFWVGRSQSRLIGKALFELPDLFTPDVKILCGDQVYLDAPWSYYLTHKHDADELEERFFQTYLETWTQENGFADVLATSANYFASDDHEFWNNAPNLGAYVVDTWFSASAKDWWAAARGLYEVFQTKSVLTIFDVAPVSFCIVDSRLNRDADEKRFMTDADLQRVVRWILDLKGPGVLSLGQPLFSGPAGILGNVADWGLPDYEQYATLVRALHDTPHDILFLTGDVHYGRVATCTLRSGKRIVEVISSPLALVDDSVGGTWSAAPDSFPVDAVAKVASAAVLTCEFKSFDFHFLTLQLSESGSYVQVKVQFWPIWGKDPSHVLPAGTEVYQGLLS